jgi:hypothetical protein
LTYVGIPPENVQRGAILYGVQAQRRALNHLQPVNFHVFPFARFGADAGNAPDLLDFAE